MKNKLPFFIVLLFFAFPQNVKAYDFSAVAPSGQTLYYNITNITIINGYWTGSVEVTYQTDIYPRYYNLSGGLVIPDSIYYNGIFYRVESIGRYAFEGCTGLVSITFGSNISSIGIDAFNNCNNLVNTYYGGTLAQWCNIDFEYYTANPLCYSHKLYINNNEVFSLVIPDGITIIKDNAFCGSDIYSVSIPNSVTSIGNAAFSGCSYLNSVTIGSSVDSIKGGAFGGCGSLSHTYYNGSAGQWCGIWFHDATSNPINYSKNLYINNSVLSNLVIPEGITEIKNHAFIGCSTIVSVSIPNTVTRIGVDAFCGCIGMNSINIPNSVTSIEESAFHGCSSLTTITIPDGITSIEPHTFDHCINLVNIIIPNTVTEIKRGAFQFCSGLRSITLPSSVTNIGQVAFAVCGITSMYLQCSNPPVLGLDCFYQTGSVNYYVPCNNVEEYQGDINWGGFSARIHGIPYWENSYNFSSNNDSCGMVTIGEVDCDSNITVTAIPNSGYFFAGWSDGGADNPRTFHLTGDTTVTAIFSDTVTLFQLTVTSNDATMGSVTGSGSYPYGTEVTITATPAQGYRFDHWSDSSTQANYTFTLTDNLQLVAFFMPEDNGNDTVYVPIYIHDTIMITDTLWQTQYVHDTTVVTIHDSVVFNHYYHDTTFVHDYIHDTVMSYINHYVHDTTFVNNYVHDTVWMSSHVFDTTIVNIYQFDTTMVNLNIFDTTIVNNYIFDTVFISNYYYDTVHVHDTVYITQEGINGVDALNAKVYSSQGQIVVEGANGNMVTLYDVTGRTLISKQDEYTPLHFDAPASGTYLIKIGNHPARKVVVIR